MWQWLRGRVAGTLCRIGTQGGQFESGLYQSYCQIVLEQCDSLDHPCIHPSISSFIHASVHSIFSHSLGALTHTDEPPLCAVPVRSLFEANSIHVCGAGRCDDVINNATIVNGATYTWMEFASNRHRTVRSSSVCVSAPLAAVRVLSWCTQFKLMVIGELMINAT